MSNKYNNIAEAEALKSSTRERAAFTEQVLLTPSDLETIKDQAHRLYLNHADGSTVRAYVQATLDHLVKIGVLR